MWTCSFPPHRAHQRTARDSGPNFHVQKWRQILLPNPRGLRNFQAPYFATKHGHGPKKPVLTSAWEGPNVQRLPWPLSRSLSLLSPPPRSQNRFVIIKLFCEYITFLLVRTENFSDTPFRECIFRGSRNFYQKSCWPKIKIFVFLSSWCTQMGWVP